MCLRPSTRSPGCSWWELMCASPRPWESSGGSAHSPVGFPRTHVQRGSQPQTRGDPVTLSGILSLLSPFLCGTLPQKCGADPTLLHSHLCFLHAVRSRLPFPALWSGNCPLAVIVCSALFSWDYRPELPRGRYLERTVPCIFWVFFLFFILSWEAVGIPPFSSSPP